jgi:hypothetical protein
MDEISLMKTPIAKWPDKAVAAARTLINTPAGLARLRAARGSKKAWVVQQIAAGAVFAAALERSQT